MGGTLGARLRGAIRSQRGCGLRETTHVDRAMRAGGACASLCGTTSVASPDDTRERRRHAAAMTSWLSSGRGRPRVVVAGGGVAAFEACLLLRAYVTEEEVEIELLTPSPRFTYRPLSVLESFGGERAWSMPLERFAADQDLDLVPDALAEVLPSEGAVLTTSGARRPYDLLLVAIGARAVPQLPGAITFQGSTDAPAVRRMLDDAATRLRPRIVFAVGPGLSWPLPLYELALLTAGELRDRGVRAEVTLATPEAAPLELFGVRAGEVVGRLLDEQDIKVVCGVQPTAVADGALEL